jgi:hypothetical protein
LYAKLPFKQPVEEAVVDLASGHGFSRAASRAFNIINGLEAALVSLG